MPEITLTSLQELKRQNEKIAMLTCYDAIFAKTASEAGVEMLLVGDSLGMVLQGQDSTLPVTLEHMIYHTQCVQRGNQGAMIVADMPFMANATTSQTLNSAARLMQAGAHMIKLEGAGWLAADIRRLAELGIPTCAHLGLTPQSVNLLGGYRLQGRQQAQAQQMVEDAHSLRDAGAALLLLECVPSPLAQQITKAVDIPVIGIGAGEHTDGQVLVLHDLLGLSLSGRTPKFVRNFMEDQNSISTAISAYVQAVKSSQFPAPEHSFQS